MPRLDFKNKQEFDQYMAQNPNVKGTVSGFGMNEQKVGNQPNFFESLLSGIVDPFLGLAEKGGEASVAAVKGLRGQPGLDKFLSGSPEYKSSAMNQEVYDDFAKNPFLSTFKDVAGVGATFVPIGKVGQGIGALAKNSAIASGLSSFANQDKENTGNINLGQVVTDGLLGGALGGGVGVLQKGLPFGKGGGKVGESLPFTKITDSLDNFANGRDLNVFKRAVGSPAPQRLGGALLEKESMDLAKKFGVNVNNADDLSNLSQNIFKNFGDEIATASERATQQGLKVDLNDVIKPLEDKLAKGGLLPEMAKPIEEVISSIRAVAPDGMIDPSTAFKLKQQVGELGKFNPFVDPANASKAGVFQDVYGGLSDNIKSTLEKSGYGNYTETNKLLESAIKQGKWADVATGKVRPTATLNDMAQDVGGFIGLSSGNPLLAIPGTIAGKVLQSPITEKALAKGARGLSSVIKGSAIETGGPMQGIGKFLQNGIGGVGNIANGNLGKAVQRGLPFGIGSQAFNQGQPKSTTQKAETNTSSTKTPAYNASQDPEVQAVLQQLMTPTKQGGKGFSPNEAEKYMKITYGIDLSGGKGGSVAERKQTGQAEASLSNLDEISNLLKKDPSILQKSILPEFLQDENTRKFKNLTSATAENFGRLQSGGAISKDEEKRFNDQIYSIFATPDSQQNKIDIMKNILSKYL